LGAGSFGAVARVRGRDRDYALKAFIPSRGKKRLSLEGEILSELDHPGIPRFVEAFCHEGVDYLVQEYVEGYPLSYYIVKGWRFSEEEVWSILFQLLGILEYLHEPRGKRLPVVHKDLRLSNVFWSDNRVSLIDFGHAGRFTGETRRMAPLPDAPAIGSARHPGKGTYRLLRKEVSPRSDLFGAGVVALDAFTNWIDDEELFQRPWQEIFPASDFLRGFIERLLMPDRQFGSAREALTYFKQERAASGSVRTDGLEGPFRIKA